MNLIKFIRSRPERAWPKKIKKNKEQQAASDKQQAP
jgi:hypothetical protein